MRIALIGQPNCGKSTLFNQVAGYKAETGNFPGTSVTYTGSKVRVSGEVVEVIDLPGTYTLAGSNPAEREVLSYLSCNDVDVIINVLDATHLAQGLDLTLELMELGKPLVVAVNVIDEAARLGLTINGPRLQEILGVPVLPLVASKGRGVRPLFVAAHRSASSQPKIDRPIYGTDLEEKILEVSSHLNGQVGLACIPLKPEPLAIKLLEGDEALSKQLFRVDPGLSRIVKQAQIGIETSRGQSPLWVFDGERHGLAGHWAQQVVEQGERRITWRDRLDDVLLHPVLGYISLIAVLFLFFEFVYGFGRLIESPTLVLLDALTRQIGQFLAAWPLLSGVGIGLMQGISGGIAIVLPYLLPFLLGLGLLEDIGYLPRVAFLMDALMHRMGLHGKAVVPFILGYGCNVPAVMSTRMLEDKRDRFLASALATLVPCAARLSVVFGLVAFYLGPASALAIYLFNLFVIALTGRILTKLMPEDTPGLILEIPSYRMPTLRTVFHKAWFRVKEFIVEAWPALIVGSIVLALLNYFGVTPIFNLLVRPLTYVLGLPAETGSPLIFGILRKELSLIMLRQALGVTDFAQALSAVQMVTYTVFVVFYVPCLATLSVLKRELNGMMMLAIAGLTIAVATAGALVARAAALLVQ